MDKVYSINRDRKSDYGRQYVAKLSHRYYSHYSIIELLIYYVINLNVISSSMVFNDLVSVFLSIPSLNQ